MRCSSGARKLLKVQPMVVSGVGDSGPLVVYLFDDAEGETRARPLRWEEGRGSRSGSLTAREMEVLRYMALGWNMANIAVELGVSPHTVRNHSTNLRRKLDVKTQLEAVITAVRMGVLTFDDERRDTGGS